MNRQIRIAIALSAGMLVAAGAQAQATVKPDGKWRHVLGAGASFASGNSDAKMLNLDAEGVRATATSASAGSGSGWPSTCATARRTCRSVCPRAPASAIT